MAKTLTILTAALVMLTALPGSSQAEVVWRGDFESGDLTQWSAEQSVSPDRMQLVSNPAVQGDYAMKVTVRQGDNPIGASGNRNELVWRSFEDAGTERYFRWQTMWSQDYPNADTWQLFTQWHHEGSGGSPPVEFYVWGEEVRLRVGGSGAEPIWTTPLARGQWHDFVFHVKWSPDATEGFVELWYDGQLVVPKTFVATQYPGERNYLKQGLYRGVDVAQDGVVYHDGMVVGTTLQDVASSAASGDSAAASVGSAGGKVFGYGAASANDGETIDPTGLDLPGGGVGCSAAPSAVASPALLLALVGLLRRKRK